ncbi:MAG: ABC transporter permease [Anaerolineae bacterium]
MSSLSTPLIYFMRLGGSFTAEYMFGSIVSEASDRTLEIVLSSVSPLQFLLGKLLGLLAVGLTQLGLWGGVVLALSLGTSALLGFDLTGFLLTWEHLGLMLSVLLGAYLLDQMLAAALGLLKVSGGAGSLFYSSLLPLLTRVRSMPPILCRAIPTRCWRWRPASSR